jgi:putative peptide zinc metalloprotease protein
VLEAEVRQLDLVYAAQRTQDVVRAELTRQRREVSEAGLARVEEEIERLTIRAPTSGRFILPRAADLGALRRQGLGGGLRGRAAGNAPARGAAAGRDRPGAQPHERRGGADRRAAGRDPSGGALREVPAAGYSLPTKALSTDGGGRVFLDPRDPSGMRTLQSVFQLELTVPGSEAADLSGGAPGCASIMARSRCPDAGTAAVRQVFLREFSL